MKRILIYLVCLILTFAAPVDSSDVGKLLPIECVLLYEENGNTVLLTDTENYGCGATVQEALKNLKQTTPDLVYLDTARYLIVHENALSHIPHMRGILKRNVKVCKTDSQVNPKDAARFLRVHEKIPKLKSWNPGQTLPLLTVQNERMIFAENDEINT